MSASNPFASQLLARLISPRGGYITRHFEAQVGVVMLVCIVPVLLCTPALVAAGATPAAVPSTEKETSDNYWRGEIESVLSATEGAAPITVASLVAPEALEPLRTWRASPQTGDKILRPRKGVASRALYYAPNLFGVQSEPLDQFRGEIPEGCTPKLLMRYDRLGRLVKFAAWEETLDNPLLRREEIEWGEGGRPVGYRVQDVNGFMEVGLDWDGEGQLLGWEARSENGPDVNVELGYAQGSLATRTTRRNGEIVGVVEVQSAGASSTTSILWRDGEGETYRRIFLRHCRNEEVLGVEFLQGDEGVQILGFRQQRRDDGFLEVSADLLAAPGRIKYHAMQQHSGVRCYYQGEVPVGGAAGEDVVDRAVDILDALESIGLDAESLYEVAFSRPWGCERVPVGIAPTVHSRCVAARDEVGNWIQLRGFEADGDMRKSASRRRIDYH